MVCHQNLHPPPPEPGKLRRLGKLKAAEGLLGEDDDVVGAAHIGNGLQLVGSVHHAAAVLGVGEQEDAGEGGVKLENY